MRILALSQLHFLIQGFVSGSIKELKSLSESKLITRWELLATSLLNDGLDAFLCVLGEKKFLQERTECCSRHYPFKTGCLSQNFTL